MTDEELAGVSEGRAWYDDEVAPLLAEASRKCQARGVAIVATVEFDPGVDRYYTFYVPKGSGLAMKMLHLCAIAGENVDVFVLALRRYCNENGVDTSGSIFLRMFGDNLEKSKP